jgi:toxin ParE1/3/4
MSWYELTPPAMADLREIARYTRKTWGPKQAEHYGEELKLALQQLAISPQIGQKRDTIAPVVRSLRVAQHIAFYVQHKGKVTILRILHPRMDADEAFEKAGEDS